MHDGVADAGRLAAALAVAACVLAGSAAAHRARPERFEAWFTERSYAPGARAALVVRAPSARVRVQVFRIGAGRSLPGGRRLTGMPVGEERRLTLARDARGLRRARIRIRDWESGLYFLRLSQGSRTRYAPFVVRPARLGASRVAVVLPTNTWQAYNKLDADGDGVGDSWYTDWKRDSVPLSRPFRGVGVPPRFEAYDLGFLRYLQDSGRNVDVLADDDLGRFATGAQLARLYDLIVFPGHEEYITHRVYGLVRGFRDRGGNLMFLSADNFFSRVAVRGGVMRRIGRWRDVGRPEAALVGVQYFDWSETTRLRPLVVRGADRAPWLFAGTGLHNGSRFGHFGIEIDSRTKASPAATVRLAHLPHAFGRRRAAEMTYYETKAGAGVFAAGVMNFGGSASNPVVAQMLDNLWARLAPAETLLRT